MDITQSSNAGKIMKKNNWFLKSWAFAAMFLLWEALYILEVMVAVRHRGYFSPVSHNHDLVLLLLNLSYYLTIPLLIIYFPKIPIFNNWLKKIIKIALALILTLLYQFSFFIVVYHLLEDSPFDWTLFWFHRADAFATAFNIYHELSAFVFIVLPLSLLGFFLLFLFEFRDDQPKTKGQKIFSLTLFIILIANFISIGGSPAKWRGEFISFLAANIGGNQQIRWEYLNHYNEQVKLQAANPVSVTPASLDQSRKILGQNIFFIHLESLDSDTVTPKITPNLLKYSQQGIYFSHFHSNSVQTIRVEENILCGLPPTLREPLINSQNSAVLNQLSCLPRILADLNYQTLFFKSDSLAFANTGDFMTAVGFQEIHSEDIMQPDDTKLPWGFREDIFYQRALDYLEKIQPDKQLFVYLAVSATNHVPFTIHDEKFKDLVPYPRPEDFYQKLANTTFIQDAYFGELMDNLLKTYGENSTFIIFGDHGWPDGRHNDNYFNEVGSYEESYSVPLIFIPPQTTAEYFSQPKVVSTYYSQMDILPTLLELIGLNNPYLLGNQLGFELLKDQTSKIPLKPILTIQPYNGGFINLLSYPVKRQLKISSDQLFIFDLAQDPNEDNPMVKPGLDDYQKLIANWFKKSVTGNQ